MKPASGSPQATMKVFVHVARGFDEREWRRRWENGELVGINDPTPYGYGRAEALGCHVTFSKDDPEGFIGKYLRLALRLVLGFDFLHARRNAREMFQSDVIWTHTESQFLAVALLFRLHGTGKGRPKLLGQSVWLFDRWQSFSPLRRAFFSRLVRSVDLLTVHSRENRAIAQKLFPDKWIETVPFGIPEQDKSPVRVRTGERAEVLSVGNDEHRDWQTAIKALRGRGDIDLTIISGRADPALAAGAPNVRIVRVGNNGELRAAFERATMMLVPLKANHHASGITVIQEAALHGVPVIATDTGGLRDYFDDDAVTYVPVGDADAIRRAVLAVVDDPTGASRKAARAQGRMGSGGLGADAYIAQHVQLSRRLLET